MQEEKNATKEEEKIKIVDLKDENDNSEDTGGDSKEKSKKLKNKKHQDVEKENLHKKIEELKKENEDLLAKIKYSQAELINYRNRKDEEVENLLKYSNKDIITDIIPIVDNFERAISLDDNNLDDELSKFLVGFKMIYSQLTEILRKYEVTEISRAGEIFDHNLEQALMTDTVADKKDDEVLEVLLKGYKLKDRVIRPATVKINKLDNEKSEEI